MSKAGVFEYLLGELIKVIAASGKGQLIFTSHNLRVLEVLDNKRIVFTTTDENNRYKRMPHYKATNNLRAMYIRSLWEVRTSCITTGRIQRISVWLY